MKTKAIIEAHPWLRMEHLVLMKIGLSATFLAVYMVPPPYNIVVGAGANLVWLWKV
jgi:hypothetical protein